MASIETAGAWEHRAACRAVDGELFFAPGPGQERQAKAVCQGCPVRWECLAWALGRRIEHGIWGGLTDRERRRILNRSRETRFDPALAMRLAGRTAS